jgi:tetratricopeptide (TPR) repeat protein
VNTRGPAAPEVERVYVRASELCQQLGDTRQLFSVLWGLWYAHLIRGEMPQARELGEELLDLAQRLQDPILFLEAHGALGPALFWLGELDLAQTQLKQVVALYDQQHHRTHALRYGRDSGIFCHSLGAVNLWLLGYPDQARQWSAVALE